MVGERQASLFGDRPDRMDELKPRFLRLWRQCGRLDRFQERNAEECGVAFEDLDRLRAEAAAGFVDDAAKSLVRLAIVGHGREAK